jgi:hypothetical protein
MAPLITTAAGRPVAVGHYGFPDPAPQPAPAGTTLCSYTHFDLTKEELNCSSRYNCWGFTFIPRRYTILTGADVDRILEDNCTGIADGALQPGDVIRYRNGGITTHTGRIWSVDPFGHATVVRSKWGAAGEYFHPPLVVPTSYGTDLAYFRQHSPLNGVADLWIADSPVDNGEQFSHQPWWTSPDLMVDVPPYDGSGDPDPQLSVTNRIWARLRNRASTDADNVFVRYYWADPSAGLGPADWHAVPSTPGHPNPAGPITVPALGSVDAPYVEWVPAAASAHQCLLAIAYVNDNPADSDNPDPLVYPFDVPWDNNIAQRNVYIINAKLGSRHQVKIRIKNPFPHLRRPIFEIRVAMTHAPRLLITGPERPVRMPGLGCTLSNRKKIVMRKITARNRPSVKGRPAFPVMSINENTLATGALPALPLTSPLMLTLDIVVPENAKGGTSYYIHVTQHNDNRICGGYTVVVIVRGS